MNAYVGAGYGITFVVLAIYGVRVVWRERVLRRDAPRPRPADDAEQT